ncbi:MAG TPA: hypothetical protein VJU87_06765 [Gemmatimonadaceae bacterium]|nr:hypothetical protein [Gemmatimonadaceae bacterium]
MPERARIAGTREVNVPCTLFTGRARPRIPHILSFASSAVMIAGMAAQLADAQQPPSASTIPAQYRAPSIVLAIPAAGGGIPADKPVIVLRFTPGDGSDAIDPSSLRIVVDGQDRSALFQVGDGEAWGPLGPAAAHGGGGVTPGSSSTSDTPISATAVVATGEHLVSARICSSRGVCGSLNAPVLVLPSTVDTRSTPTPDSDAATGSSHSTLRKVLDALLSGARKLLLP